MLSSMLGVRSGRSQLTPRSPSWRPFGRQLHGGVIRAGGGWRVGTQRALRCSRRQGASWGARGAGWGPLAGRLWFFTAVLRLFCTGVGWMDAAAAMAGRRLDGFMHASQEAEREASACHYCKAAPAMTNVFCIRCRRVCCRQCGSGHGDALAGLVVCMPCEMDGVQELLVGDKWSSVEQRKYITQLVRGNRRVQVMRLREGTKSRYRSQLQPFGEWIEKCGWKGLGVVTEYVLELYCIELLRRGLDSSTVGGHIRAVWDMYHYFATSLPELRGLVNPAEGARLKQTLKTIGANYKLKSKAKSPIARSKAQALMARGFDSGVAAGWRQDRHARLYYVLLTLSMLRQGALSKLVIRYHIENGKVVFEAGSAVTILHDPKFGEYIMLTIEEDKNVTAEKVRCAYIPVTPGMGVDGHAAAVWRLPLRPPQARRSCGGLQHGGVQRFQRATQGRLPLHLPHGQLGGGGCARQPQRAQVTGAVAVGGWLRQALHRGHRRLVHQTRGSGPLLRFISGDDLGGPHGLGAHHGGFRAGAGPGGVGERR